MTFLATPGLHWRLATPGLHGRSQASPGCGERGCSRCGPGSSHCCGFSRCAARALKCASFSSCSPCALEPRSSWVHRLSYPWNVESSWTRYRTRVPWIGWKTVNHWTTREVFLCLFLSWLSSIYTFHLSSLLDSFPSEGVLRHWVHTPRDLMILEQLEDFVPCGWHDLPFF